MERRLAAIMAADVVGYSRLMEQDEARTLAALKTRRQTILDPLLAQRRGRVVKTLGDGVLVEFASALDAVECAIELQRRMAAANDAEHDAPPVVLRIGINLGDVIVEQGDIYGDGVNIAARLEGLAEPGCVLVSGKVFEEVRGKASCSLTPLGERTLKNISRPIAVYQCQPAAVGVTSIHPPPQDRPSVAVLPFDDMSGGGDRDYFCDGITEDIITELSRFRSLFVIARNSSFQFRGQRVDSKRIGRELGVQYVVEGSIRRSGSRMRLTAQLIDALSGIHVWADRYDRDLEDIFALQDELAHALAAIIGNRVEAAGRSRIARLSPTELRVYELVLRARGLWSRFTRRDNEEAKALLQRAIALDPSNAQAHAYCAHTCFMQYMAWWVEDRDAALRDAAELAVQAVSLDDSDATARWVLGLVHLHRRNFAEARVHMERAFDLNPNDAHTIAHLAYFHSCVGELDLALSELETLRRRSPLDDSRWLMGIAYYTARRYEPAIAALTAVHEPVNEIRLWLAVSLAQAGRRDEAAAKLQQFLDHARADMARFPGGRLAELRPYLDGIVQYQDEKDLDHLLEGLRLAGAAE
jgi:TolB-like protein/class 3 adenylate cyclase